MKNSLMMPGKLLTRLLVLAVTVYLGILCLLMIFETNLVYPGSKYPRGNWSPANFEFEEIAFDSGDGTRLVGWFLPAPQRPSDFAEGDAEGTGSSNEAVLLCHGNAENVAQSAGYIGRLLSQNLNADVFVFDYRGYGKSEGTPDEQGVLADAVSAFAWLQERCGKTAAGIIVVGHSIGGGPAVHLASEHGCKVLVLQRTFNSLADAAQKQYPWLPVKYIVRNRYPSVEKIRRYAGPLFQSHGEKDSLIPIELAKQLFAAAPTTNKQWLEFKGMGHLDPLPEDYWSTLKAFIDALP